MRLASIASPIALRGTATRPPVRPPPRRSAASARGLLLTFYDDALREGPWSIVGDRRVRGIDFIRFRDADNPGFEGELRINQEDRGVLILIADLDLAATDS